MRIRRNEALEYAYQERKWRINEKGGLRGRYASIYIYPYTWWEDENYRKRGENWRNWPEFYSKDGYVVDWKYDKPFFDKLEQIATRKEGKEDG